MTQPKPILLPSLASSTLYTVTVTDSNGCTTTAQIMVNVAPPLTVTASADDNIIGACPSSVANLNATGAGGELLSLRRLYLPLVACSRTELHQCKESCCQAGSYNYLYGYYYRQERMYGIRSGNYYRQASDSADHNTSGLCRRIQHNLQRCI